jgi:hypothetical protein
MRKRLLKVENEFPWLNDTRLLEETLLILAKGQPNFYIH